MPAKPFRTSAAETGTGPLRPDEVAGLFDALARRSGVILAVSGGGDSVALLLAYADWLQARPDRPFSLVATIDHGLRADSRTEAETVGRWCAGLGLSHDIVDIAPIDPGRNVQDQARRARYDALMRLAARRGCDTILTAHHRDDQAETLLIRLARGSGVDGLSAMAPETEWSGIAVMRPFINIAKERLLATLEARGHPFFDDPSNESDRFLRTRLRKMMPQLARDGLTRERLAATAARLRRARTALEIVTLDHLDRSAVLDPGGFATVDSHALVDAPEEIALRALSRLVLTVGGGPYPTQIEKIEGLYERILVGNGKRFAGATLGGCRIVPERGRLLFVRELGRANGAEIRLDPGEATVFDHRFQVGLPEDAPRGAVVRPLGVDGWSHVGEAGARRALPAVAGRTLPAFFIDGALIAAPHAEGLPARFAPEGFRADFIDFRERMG